MTNDFLPEGYQAPASKSNYLKLEEGSNKFRILSKSIVGWLDWTNDKKPSRTREYPFQLVNHDKPAKHFWAFVIFDYKTSSIKILELTQRTVQNAIIELYKNDDWGNPTGYDITIQKTGKDMETKYNVIPSPHKPMTGDVLSLHESMNINLEALYSNGDPFANATNQHYDVMSEATPGVTGDDSNLEVDKIAF